jgi:5'-3' exonuclease
MYYVLRKMPAVSSATSKGAWEGDFCNAIAAYMAELVTLAKPTKGVYVSCDGAVCAAKRRQQRLRRFKGPWIASLEAQVTGVPVATDKWDQNALTPGSAFMARLGDVLTAEGTRLQTANKIEVVVSTTKEAGEGEHKLMTHMRLVTPASCTIYGLDADLILLAMLLGVDTGASVRLMREAQEFEQKGSGQGWRNLDVRALAAAIIPQVTDDKVRDFVASMTLLGNDFLPRSLTHTVRDDGIPDLVTALGSWVWSTGRRVIGSDGSVSRDGLLALVRSWSQTEERDLVVAAISAQKASRYPPGIGATPEETALKEWNSQPARWASVCQILNPRERQALHPDWLTVYKGWHPGSAVNYLNGVAWTWDYYSGRAVDQGWFFDEHLPPLWSDVATTLSSSTSASVTPPPIMYPTPLPDWLHLLAVLPADSVVQLLPHSVQKLMGAYPWYWPTSWTVFDVGKTQLWECEPVIPVIPEVVLRSMKEKGS